ncbi:hypothetical protein OKJ48_23235 [Streptomyces kunmingensis]|uniref:Uncharacterized protein n=1 Tax=Streptomyces kunmingensis TaxID=68225 RepID=A0ABU6CEK4_9ACTN|nr:hypothetical protein [Streptomyces kunmingensis]MEB3963138.1 hypothetical protein [Streptomyces kunmingensis]
MTVDDVRDRAGSERDIAAACDHLVSGTDVMDLQGGMVRARSDQDDEYRLDARKLPSACTIYKEVNSHKSTDLFRLIVKSSDDSEPLNLIGDQASPFLSTTNGYRLKDDVTAAADRELEEWPLGDGSLGSYTNFRTTIRAVCRPGSARTAPKLLHVTAVARYTDVSAEDRQRLARIARAATQQLTRRTGCKTQLPSLPESMAPNRTALRSLSSAAGSCRWAGRLAKEGQGRLPDRALAHPARTTTPVESCLLAVGPRQVKAIAVDLDADQHDYVEGALTYSPWWLRTVSYFGAETHSVGYDSGPDTVLLKPGTAGGASGAWWASSICDGKPALHTLVADHIYADVLGEKALSSLFRAYVDDITTRRGCTHVVYPTAKDFRER